MFEQQPQNLREKVKSLATESSQQENPSGWFETLYAEANGDSRQVPWAKNSPHPYLQDWLELFTPSRESCSALVIGCGLGDDAEALANQGYQVTAFDISPTAIAWCKKRFPHSTVTYLFADLFNLPSLWNNSFDLVYECRNIQALPLSSRKQVIGAIASLVSAQGTILVITRLREDDAEPDGPPWALSEQELSQFSQLGLTEMRRDVFVEGEDVIVKQVRIEYRSRG